MTERPETMLDIARRFGVSRTTVFNAIADGTLPSFRVGKLIRVLPSSVPEHLTRRWGHDPYAPDTGGWPTEPVVYFLVGAPGYVRIGFSSDVRRRAFELQAGSPLPFQLVAHIPDGSIAIERQYHRRFADARRCGEWFEIVPELQAEIARLAKINPCPCGPFA